MTSLILRDRNRTPSIWNSFFNDLAPDSFFTDVFRGSTPRQFTQESPVKVHIDKKDTAYDVSIAAPGISKNEVDVTVKEDVLTVAHEQRKEEGDKYFCSSFTKSWTLPKDVDADKITASYESGVFSVNLPRVQPVEPEVKKIKVK